MIVLLYHDMIAHRVFIFFPNIFTNHAENRETTEIAEIVKTAVKSGENGNL